MIDRELIFNTQYNGYPLKNETASNLNIPYSLSIIPAVQVKINLLDEVINGRIDRDNR
jgi:hypothetical protein